MKRAHGYKHQHCDPKLKKTTSQTTVGPAKDNHQASTNNFQLNIKAVIESQAWTTAVQLKSAA